jgi:hypothetical protein
VIDILVIAVVGGIARPIGPFIGALIYVLLRTFSPDVLTAFGLSGERFKLLIGLGFLAVVFFSPDGVLGLWERWQERRREGARPADRGRGMTLVETRSTAERLGSVSSGNALELRGVTKMFGALAAIRDVTLTVGRASAARCWARTARARPRCSTASPGISCPPRARSGCSART